MIVLKSWLDLKMVDTHHVSTINLVTTLDLVTVFGMTKFVTKSKFDCIRKHVKFQNLIMIHQRGNLLEVRQF